MREEGLVPVSSVAIFAMSSGVSFTFEAARFSAMRAGETVFEIEMMPRSASHASTTCATVAPRSAAISLSTGFSKRPSLPSAKGAHAEGMTPSARLTASASRCWQNGFTSI